jgi:hypothetical protein
VQSLIENKQGDDPKSDDPKSDDPLSVDELENEDGSVPMQFAFQARNRVPRTPRQSSSPRQTIAGASSVSNKNSLNTNITKIDNSGGVHHYYNNFGNINFPLGPFRGMALTIFGDSTGTGINTDQEDNEPSPSPPSPYRVRVPLLS